VCSDDETANKIYTGELEFVQENLKLNPKSYWMWNHRRWCLESMSQPRWDRELAMVGRFLEMDARNCKFVGCLSWEFHWVLLANNALALVRVMSFLFW
jgi:hypothetical protein